MPLPGRDTNRSSHAPVFRLTMPSPVGALTLFEQSGTITLLVWAAGDRIRNARPTPLLAAAQTQLEAYFDGRLDRFHLPLALDGSPFQQRVWQAISEIPAGGTETYGALARRLGSAPRAIGGACGANPIPIIIPCHRVVGAGGRLSGYSGRGGLTTKKRLLDLERAYQGPLDASGMSR
jgi:methylated-DNA-[protein]-cysteine S-methyltransferase